MLLKIFVIWCIIYTIVDLIYWAYYYFNEYRDRHKTIIDDSEQKTFLKENISEDNIVIEEPYKGKKFKILNPVIFLDIMERIIQNFTEINANVDDEFSDGRLSAYLEILNIFKFDFNAYDVEFGYWNYNMPHHIIDKIIKRTDQAVFTAKEYKNDSFFNGREAAHLEVIDIIVSNFVKHNVNLEEYGLTRFKRD